MSINTISLKHFQPLLWISLFTIHYSLFAQSQPWQMTHGSNARRGYANATGPQTNHLKWKYKLGNAGPVGGNSVAISGTHSIYVCGPDKITKLYTGGGLAWTQKYPGAEGPCLANDGMHVYFVADSAIVCLDTNGVQQWAYVMGNTGIFGPTLSTDGLYLFQGCWDHNVYAITSAGTLKWKYLTHGCVSYNMALTPGGSLIVGGGDAHCGTDSIIYSIGNTESTSPITNWTYVAPTGHWGGPAIGRNGVIYASEGPTLYALDTATGTVKWSVGAGIHNVAGVVNPGLYNDTTASSAIIYTGAFTGRFYCVSAATKDTVWAFQTGKDPKTGMTGLPCFPVVDAKGDVYIGSNDYNVYGLNKSGTKLWSYTTGGDISEASPALDKGNATLYVTSGDGNLYAFADSVVTGMANVEASRVELTVSPNPSKGTFFIEVKSEELRVKNIEVYNLLGEKVHSQFNIQNSEFNIDLSSQPNGIYLLRIQLPDGSVVTKKVEVVR